jgi:hypothetical protein
MGTENLTVSHAMQGDQFDWQQELRFSAKRCVWGCRDTV